ncbi:hypothetical protein PCANC_25035 [Puccinia coronata f. sp. avenae]|uniref:Uncharacterized protein n=1 Tax=Puccinia coronata f. sp. avenae TaxID=200324 RepID=A0A2N5S5Y1_9BASI|nr:hypothetical protein PCANC_25035 [Puccinia coronata f. sp. avenae]
MTQINIQQEERKQPQELSGIYEALGEQLTKEERLKSISNPLSLIALITHAILLAHSFQPKPKPKPKPEPEPATTAHIIPHEQLILTDHEHSTQLSYSHPQSSLTFQLTLSKIGHRIAIAAIPVEHDRLSSVDFSLAEYLDPAQFPLTLTKELQTTSIGLRSATHLLDFLTLFVTRILSHLLPDLIPPANPNSRPPPLSSSSTTTTQPAPEPSQQPNHHHHQVVHQPSPLEIGRSDLDPIGTSNLHIPSLYNAPGVGLDDRSGMLVGGNHPIFNNNNRQPSAPHAGPAAFLPPGAVPPGARFDPFGPAVSPAFPRQPAGPFGADYDPMGGLGQGLPLQNPHHGFSSGRSGFNPFGPQGGPGAGGYDDMFM